MTQSNSSERSCTQFTLTLIIRFSKTKLFVLRTNLCTACFCVWLSLELKNRVIQGYAWEMFKCGFDIYWYISTLSISIMLVFLFKMIKISLFSYAVSVLSLSCSLLKIGSNVVHAVWVQNVLRPTSNSSRFDPKIVFGSNLVLFSHETNSANSVHRSSTFGSIQFAISYWFHSDR